MPRARGALYRYNVRIIMFNLGKNVKTFTCSLVTCYTVFFLFLKNGNDDSTTPTGKVHTRTVHA